ncbi:MAG: hypothetical protein ACTSU2_10615 [Promethearchaeota archaeon]
MEKIDEEQIEEERQLDRDNEKGDKEENNLSYEKEMATNVTVIKDNESAMETSIANINEPKEEQAIILENEENVAHHNNPPHIGPFKNLKNMLSALKPIILSHHPMCDKFKDHTFRAFGKDLCIGCFITYPTIIIVLIIGYIFKFFNPENYATLIKHGFWFLSVYILSIVGLTKNKKVKILSKIVIGLGLAQILAGFWYMPLPKWLNIVVIILFSQGLSTIMNIKRVLEMNKICDKCEWKRDWEHCPGMSFFYERLHELNKPESMEQ